MIQTLLAGIVMCLMGLCMLFVPAYKIWSITEKWKTSGGKPSRSFIIVTRVLGIVFLIVGIGLLCGLL